jgi:hypothetical protein
MYLSESRVYLTALFYALTPSRHSFFASPSPSLGKRKRETEGISRTIAIPFRLPKGVGGGAAGGMPNQRGPGETRRKPLS